MQTTIQLALSRAEQFDYSNVTGLGDIFKIIDKLPVGTGWFTQEDWFTIAFIICKHYNLTINDNFILDKRNNSEGALVKLNKDYSNVVNKNVTLLQFNSLYPLIMYNHLSDYADDCLFDFKSVFRMVFVYYKLNRKDFDLSIMKLWLNGSYGILSSTNFYTYIPVATLAKTFMASLYIVFYDNIIYIDTDSIYFRNYDDISFKVKSKIEEFTYEFLSYEIEDIDNFYCIGLKKFIQFSNDSQVRGIKVS